MRSRRLMAGTFVVALTLGVVGCGEVAVEDVEDPLGEDSVNEDPAGEDPAGEDPADEDSAEGTTY